MRNRSKGLHKLNALGEAILHTSYPHTLDLGRQSKLELRTQYNKEGQGCRSLMELNYVSACLSQTSSAQSYRVSSPCSTSPRNIHIAVCERVVGTRVYQHTLAGLCTVPLMH